MINGKTDFLNLICVANKPLGFYLLYIGDSVQKNLQ